MAENKNVPRVRFSGFNDAWEQRKLGQIVKITMGQSPDSTNYTKDSNDYILVQGNSDMENGKVRPRVWTTQVTKTADRGDLILSVRAPVGDVGKTDYDVVLGRGVASIKGNEYIFQYLRMLNINGYWAKFITGSTFESINSKDINNAQVRYPVVQEQNKIGTLLEKADQAIASNQRKLDSLKSVKKALMQKIFDQTWRFEGFNDPWEQRKFTFLLDNKDGIRRGPFGSALKKEYFIKDGPYVVFEQQNAIYERFNTRYRITEEKYQELIKFSISPGDFIMSGAGTIGKIARVPVGVESGVFNQALIRFRLNKKLVSPDYFLQLMRSEPMQKRLTSANPGSAITNLVPMSELKKWNIRVPDLVEQKHIAKLLSTIDIAIASNQFKIDKLKEIKKWLMQSMFV